MLCLPCFAIISQVHANARKLNYETLRLLETNNPLSEWKECTNEPRHDKTNKLSVRPAKTQISLGIRPVWLESSLCAQWVAKDPSFLHADSNDPDQTGQMPRLICIFARCTLTLLVLSCRSSNLNLYKLFSLGLLFERRDCTNSSL